MEARTVIEFGDLKRSEKEMVVEQIQEEFIRPILMKAIELHENITLYLKDENGGELVSSLKDWGEHWNFDIEFSIDEIPNQYWYYLCNGVLYLKDMVKGIQKIIEIIQGHNVDIGDPRVYLEVCACIEEETGHLYSEIKKELNQKAISYVI